MEKVLITNCCDDKLYLVEPEPQFLESQYESIIMLLHTRDAKPKLSGGHSGDVQIMEFMDEAINTEIL